MCEKGSKGCECLLVAHVLLVSLDTGLGHEIRDGLLQVVNPGDEENNYFPNQDSGSGRTHRLPMSSMREIICSDIDWNLSCTFCSSDWTWRMTQRYFPRDCGQIFATHVNNQLFVVLRVHVCTAHRVVCLLHLVQIAFDFWHRWIDLGLRENFYVFNSFLFAKTVQQETLEI